MPVSLVGSSTSTIQYESAFMKLPTGKINFRDSTISDDVKNMMKDILLIWTSVKQLDATKADRREVDSLGAEMNCRSQVYMHIALLPV